MSWECFSSPWPYLTMSSWQIIRKCRWVARCQLNEVKELRGE